MAVGQEIVVRTERLRQAINLAGGATAVARKISMAPTTINNYLAGRDMKASALAALADACGVSIEWLAVGRGPMVRETVFSNSAASIAFESSTDSAFEKVSVVRNFRVEIPEMPSEAEAMTVSRLIISGKFGEPRSEAWNAAVVAVFGLIQKSHEERAAFARRQIPQGLEGDVTVYCCFTEKMLKALRCVWPSQPDDEWKV